MAHMHMMDPGVTPHDQLFLVTRPCWATCVCRAYISLVSAQAPVPGILPCFLFSCSIIDCRSTPYCDGRALQVVAPHTRAAAWHNTNCTEELVAALQAPLTAVSARSPNSEDSSLPVDWHSDLQRLVEGLGHQGWQAGLDWRGECSYNLTVSCKLR